MFWTQIYILVFCLCCSESRIVQEECSLPLGMEDGRIGDSQIRASSSYSQESVGPSAGRLNNEKGGGAWCPKNLITENMETQEFLEIDLEYNHVITAVVIQGRFANGRGAEFAEFYIIQYWREGMEHFINYKDENGETVLEANKNTFKSVETILDSAIVASKIRLIPFSKHARTICLRVELKGCGTNNSDPQTNLHFKSGLEEDEIDVNIETMNPVETHNVDDPFLESQYMGVAVGVLVTVILLLIIVILFILYKNYLSPSAPLLAYNHHNNLGNKNYNCELDVEPGPDIIYAVGSKRSVQLTPTTSEDNYTDSSIEYTSPLLNCHIGKESGHSRTQPGIVYKSSYTSSYPGTAYTSSYPSAVYTSPQLPVDIIPTGSAYTSSRVPIDPSQSHNVHSSISNEMTPQVHKTFSRGGNHGILKNGSVRDREKGSSVGRDRQKASPAGRDRQKASPAINWQTFLPAPPPHSHYDEPHVIHTENNTQSGHFVV